jgi:hypothetical protein
MQFSTLTLVLAAASVAVGQTTTDAACLSAVSAVPACGVSPFSTLTRPRSSSPYLHPQASSFLSIFPLTISQSSCISSAASVVGCSNADLTCQCSSSASSAIVITALDCVVAACGLETGLAVSASADAVCTACVG